MFGGERVGTFSPSPRGPCGWSGRIRTEIAEIAEIIEITEALAPQSGASRGISEHQRAMRFEAPDRYPLAMFHGEQPLCSRFSR
jgi:hypothetical protein